MDVKEGNYQKKGEYEEAVLDWDEEQTSYIYHEGHNATNGQCLLENKKTTSPSFLLLRQSNFLEAGPSALGLADLAPPKLDTFAQEASLVHTIGRRWGQTQSEGRESGRRWGGRVRGAGRDRK